MKIAVIDGQGGGIGRVIIEKIRLEFGQNISIIALGTNSLATAAMLKAGANIGATGENAIIVNVQTVDVIMGSIAIMVSDALIGELSPAMANAITKSDTAKVLIPLNKCNIHVAGTVDEPLPHYIDDSIKIIKKIIGGKINV
ncbi:DUF3842 family protein [Alkalibaculum sp. M08DMB]|uniref:DUF3842 family protein n=1 Tax=Alkalibaculum sporogenes TaxID=2655001 RepID=A0A6A7KB77_9FIRM|nr:DUF3842 family protein [Alkalibaculum sporogenes]MPW26778.1 DUF3842 family protein [Alkalibaculum sporogenes]